MGLLDDVPSLTTADILARMPGRMSARDMQRIVQKRMNGIALSGAEEQALSQAEAYKAQVGEPTVMEITGVPEFGRAVRDTYNEPSIANATNAGARGAMLAFRPLAAAGILGTGLAASGIKDLGGIFGMAEAADDGLTADQTKRLADLEKRLQGQKWSSGAERRAVEDEAKELRGLKADFAKEKNRALVAAEADKKRSAQGEYDRAVKTAESVRDKELLRDRRFSDTEVGKLWDKTGGLMPLVAGLAGGSASRMVSGGGSNLKNYGMPALLGGVAGATTPNIPLAYNSFFTEPDNPERRAYEAYARELPPTHPRRQEWSDYAKGLPKANPLRETASDELYNPLKAVERMAFGAIEGAGGGIFGADVARMPGRIMDMVAGAPGRAAASYHKGMGQATEARGVAHELEQAALQRQQALQQQAQQGRGGLLSEEFAAAQPATPASPPATVAAPQPQLPPPALSQNQPALPLSKDPREWSKIWSDPARKSVEDFITNSPGAPLSSLSAPMLQKMIADKLPPGTPIPSESTTRGYLRELREHIGNEKVTLSKLQRQWRNDPAGLLFSSAGPAIGATGAGMAGLLGDWPE